MPLLIANAFVILLGLYLLFGILFAAVFIPKGLGKIDPVTSESTWGFRVMIVPGVIGLWPLLAHRWMKGVTAPPVEINPHRKAASLADDVNASTDERNA